MSLLHAVIWTDHQSAEVFQFDDDQVLATKVKAHTHNTAQHGSAVRAEHEFFGALCDAFGGVGAVLVTATAASYATTGTSYTPGAMRAVMWIGSAPPNPAQAPESPITRARRPVILPSFVRPSS